MVLTNPHNPLGVNYSKNLLEDIYTWALDNPDLHIISDEIYCHSQLHGITTPFTSAVALDAYVEHPTRIHVVWGFARGFGLSGFIVSQNAVVQDAMLGSKDTGAEVRHPMSWFTPVDSLKHHVIGAVLSASADGPGSDLYTTVAMETYRDLLSTRFAQVKGCLQRNGIKYVQHDGDNAAQFFWLDLRDYLDLPLPAGPDDSMPFPVTALGLDPREEGLFDYLRRQPTEVSLLPDGVMHSPAPASSASATPPASRKKSAKPSTRWARRWPRCGPRCSAPRVPSTPAAAPDRRQPIVSARGRAAPPASRAPWAAGPSERLCGW